MPHTEEPSALVFDVQRMSLHDGPGVRTTVFFKGCPLRCKWCHNPESYTAGVQLRYNSRLCVGCGVCAKQCPNGAHGFDGGVHSIDWSRCTGCGQCVKGCCYDALELVGKRYTVGELKEAVNRDRLYWGKDGGVTLSGGEPMQQFRFVEAFLEAKGDIPIAMETCGFAKPSQYQAILPLMDLFLFDYKATHPDKHQALCGQDNRLIVSNLRMLYESGAKIILRFPLIPGVNDDREHLEGIAALLAKYPAVLGAEVMAYHRLGVGKCDALGMSRGFDLPNADRQQKQNWLESFRALGATRISIG